MGRGRIIMKAVRKVIQLRVESQLSIRQISRLTGVSRPVAAQYLEAFTRSGLIWEEFSKLSDQRAMELLTQPHERHDPRYEAALDRDDCGDYDGLLAWCLYVLRGLKLEIEKIDRLSDYNFLRDHLLLPSVNELAERGGINSCERGILLGVARSGNPIANSDARAFFDEKVSVTHTSRLIAGLRERKLLVPISEGARTYTLGFSRSPLLRTLIRALDKEGFLPFQGET